MSKQTPQCVLVFAEAYLFKKCKSVCYCQWCQKNVCKRMFASKTHTLLSEMRCPEVFCNKHNRLT